MKTKNLLILLTFIFIYGFKINEIDWINCNKRSFDLILKEKEELKNSKVKTFETDTSINFKSKENIYKIYGKPNRERLVKYTYPSPNILWILEGPLNVIKECPVLMMEWDYVELKLERVVLFVTRDEAMISITNILYDEGLSY